MELLFLGIYLMVVLILPIVLIIALALMLIDLINYSYEKCKKMV